MESLVIFVTLDITVQVILQMELVSILFHAQLALITTYKENLFSPIAWPAQMARLVIVVVLLIPQTHSHVKLVSTAQIP